MRMPPRLTTIRPVANSRVLSTHANALSLSRLRLTDYFPTLCRPLIKPVSQSGKAFSAPHNNAVPAMQERLFRAATVFFMSRK